MRLAGGGATGAQAGDTSVVGTWNRTLVAVDETGDVTTSETTWTFAADGRATRRIVTSSLSLGLADQTLATGRWTTEGDELVVRFDPPTGGELRLPFQVRVQLDGTLLVLGGQLFRLVAP
ncbi:MAG TPA: hypothetical protein VFS08_16015 [Gemmatimonadaceae bacterium]|nr:hypothetical protein [Gemmatimonadaceae bacterium]